MPGDTDAVEHMEVPTLNAGFSMADNSEELVQVMEDMDEEGLLTPAPPERTSADSGTRTVGDSSN